MLRMRNAVNDVLDSASGHQGDIMTDFHLIQPKLDESQHQHNIYNFI